MKEVFLTIAGDRNANSWIDLYLRNITIVPFMIMLIVPCIVFFLGVFARAVRDHLDFYKYLESQIEIYLPTMLIVLTSLQVFIFILGLEGAYRKYYSQVKVNIDGLKIEEKAFFGLLSFAFFIPKESIVHIRMEEVGFRFLYLKNKSNYYKFKLRSQYYLPLLKDERQNVKIFLANNYPNIIWK